MAAAPLLRIQDLHLSFGGVVALDSASLEVPSASIVGLIGPNGAGKSTLVNAVTGLLRPRSGSIRLQDVELTGWSPERIAGAGLVRTFQVARGFPRLTVLENLMLHGREQRGEALLQALVLRGFRADEEKLRTRAVALAEQLRLAPVLNNLASQLSGGHKKLLELGRALMSSPSIVLLDEPAAGVNPALTREIGERLLELKRAGQAFLIVEHDMGLIEQVSDSVVVMAAGRRLAEGSFAEIRADRRVQDAYLGHAASEVTP